MDLVDIEEFEKVDDISFDNTQYSANFLGILIVILIAGIVLIVIASKLMFQINK